MKLLVVLILIVPMYSQIDYYSAENRLAFAEHLFCNKDYLRAIDEYFLVNQTSSSDALLYKIAYSYEKINDINKSEEMFSGLVNSKFGFFARMHLAKTSFVRNEGDNPYLFDENSHQFKKLKFMDDVRKGKSLGENVANVFNNSEAVFIKNLINRKYNPSYKSKLAAGVLSAIIPGAGKIYVGEIGDGITSLILTSLFTYLAVNNFQNNHDTRGYIFSAVTAFFYSGNIYGSVVSAHQYNLKFNFSWDLDFNFFLETNNYFITEPEIIKCQ